MDNKIKTQLQAREFENLKGKQRILLKWATGCGKSKMAIDLVTYALQHMATVLPPRILFLVGERAHIKNWQEEFKKWNLPTENVIIDIYCYASLKKAQENHYDIVVLDEAHHAFTEKRETALWTLRNNLNPNASVYLLSATMSAGKQAAIEDIFGKFIVSSVTLKEAIKQDILPDPRVYVVAMELDDKLRNQEIVIGKNTKAPIVKWENRNKYIFKKIPCVIKCTEKQKYLHYTNLMEYWKERWERSKNQMFYNFWVNNGSTRKRFMGECKTAYINKLLNKIPNNRKLVCFCSSVNQAEMLSSKYTISSRKSSQYNQAVIDDFNRDVIKRIFAVGMITEGMNLANIETGIIVQLDGKERLFIQKFGRSMRAENPVCFIFYYKNTQDEKYLRDALGNIDEKFIRHIDIKQLNSIKL